MVDRKAVFLDRYKPPQLHFRGNDGAGTTRKVMQWRKRQCGGASTYCRAHGGSSETGGDNSGDCQGVVVNSMR